MGHKIALLLYILSRHAEESFDSKRNLQVINLNWECSDNNKCRCVNHKSISIYSLNTNLSCHIRDSPEH